MNALLFPGDRALLGHDKTRLEVGKRCLVELEMHSAKLRRRFAQGGDRLNLFKKLPDHVEMRPDYLGERPDIAEKRPDNGGKLPDNIGQFPDNLEKPRDEGGTRPDKCRIETDALRTDPDERRGAESRVGSGHRGHGEGGGHGGRTRRQEPTGDGGVEPLIRRVAISAH